ncbi:hypothetical protein EC973_006399 [Apophysomyces ossiformis]|uniref:RING-type domain-containing protein n=1 Tax=Apophysomyces ossiformis TaxID=679940 RepID=A0A8H7BVT0_9FUNG|nr:hypothetical protein EC973_006399 [Apophysomyces ossiformis]
MALRKHKTPTLRASQELQVAQLVVLFPDGEHYETDHVQRVAEKILANGSHYPTVPSHGTRTDRLNHALRILATDLFPDCHVGYLREQLLQCHHSPIEQVTEAVVTVPGPERLIWGKIDRSDFIRSETYKSEALMQLAVDYPQIWKSSIRAVLAENNWDYLNSYAQLAEIGSGGFWNSIRNFFLHWSFTRRGSSSSPSSSSSSSSSSENYEPSEPELIEEIGQLRRSKAEAQSNEDEKIAHQINEIEYTDCEQLITCLCCYSDCTFEQLAFCSEGDHGFCHSCIRRYISEGLFGQGALRGAARIGCISFSGCRGCLPSRMLQRVLSQDLWSAYEASLFEANIKHSHGTIVQCASCAYSEIDESTKPLAAALEKAEPLLRVARWMMWDLRRDIQTVYDRVVRERRGNAFQCRNPACKKLTCLQCMRTIRGLHQCWEEEQDGLRLYVEKAMADAVKRTCPVCNLSFQKSDGCNKIVCRCGYAMCYVCRRDISKQSYSHFCDHFRDVPGAPCDKCKKCDLYKLDPEEEAVQKAAAKARKEYLLSHPDIAKQAPQTARMAIGPLTALEKFGKECQEPYC